VKLLHSSKSYKLTIFYNNQQIIASL